MKTFAKIISIVIIIAMLFSFAACGEKEDSVNGDSFKSADEIKSGITNGRFTIKVATSESDAEYFTIIESADGWFYGEGGENEKTPDGTLFIKDGNGYKMYTIEDNKKTFVMNYQSDDMQDMYIGNIFNTYLASYTNLDLESFKKAGTESIAGVNCVKYSYTAKLFGYEYKQEYYIDNKTGICMKCVGAGSFGDESGAYSWEVVEMKLGNASLNDLTNLPLTNNENEGTSVGNISKWPLEEVKKLAKDISISEIPEFAGGESYDYYIIDNMMCLTIDGITSGEYENYKSTLLSKGYEQSDGFYGDYSLTKSFSNNKNVLFSFSYSEESSQLTLYLIISDNK